MNENHHDRASLKKHFEAGSLPTQQDFADLIDSTLNLREDGFSRTDQDGLRVHAQVGHDGLFSFYRGVGSDKVLWSTGFAQGGEQWVMRPGSSTQPPLLLLDPSGRMGLGLPPGQAQPRSRLDINGSLSLRGRLGQPPPPAVMERQSAECKRRISLVADGDWKDLTGDLQGCQGFEVMAGAGRPEDRSRFALLHAFAFNVYHPAWWQDWFGTKRRIRQQHAFYGRYRDRLELRWHSRNGEHGKGASYRLQIRSRCDYAGHQRNGGNAAQAEVPLHVYLTQLWFQPHMEAQPQMEPAAAVDDEAGA